MILFLISYFATAEKYSEYRLWNNFGQIIYDYSSNGRHAVNGLSHLDQYYDCSYTDRGFLFADKQAIC